MYNPSPKLVSEARDHELSAVQEVVAKLDPQPNKEVDTDMLFKESENAMVKYGFIEKGDGTVGITEKGQILLSILFARTQALSEFVLHVDMPPQDMKKIISSLSDKELSEKGIATAVLTLLKHTKSGQPGLLLNFFSFLVYRAIARVSEVYGDDDGTTPTGAPSGTTLH